MQFEKVIDDELLEGGGQSKKIRHPVKHIEPANCDEEDKCCKCIPLRLGVKFLIIICLFNAYLMYATAHRRMKDEKALNIICMILMVGPLYAFCRFIVWYRN